MEFEEQKEFVNPQNGEKIAPKKPKKFWLEWRFWVWSFIALMLFVVSVSSMVTACAAIGSGVGSGEKSTSQVAREKKAAYYRDEFVQDYGTEVGYVYNYVCDMKTAETYGNFWYMESKDTEGCATGLRAFSALEEQYVDVYQDGVYSGTYYLPYDYGYMYHPFIGTHYYWLFANERGVPSSWNGYYNGRGYFGTSNNYFYNYSSWNLHVDSNAVQNSSVDFYAGNPYAYDLYARSAFYTYAGTRFYITLLDSDQTLKDHVFLDVYCDGVFYKRVPVMWNHEASWNNSYAFDLPASHYYWFFNADMYSVGYSAGYDAGAAQVLGFDSVGTNAMYSFDNDLTGLTNYSYPMFDFVDADLAARSVWLVPYSGTSLVRAKFVVKDGYDVSDDNIRTIGECYLDGTSNVFSGSGTYSDYSSANSVIKTVYNNALSRGIFRFVSSDVSPYATGYSKGYSDGESVGYTLGKVDGANSVHPEALTNTLVAVFQQPFNQIYRFFNFNVLGLNILGLVCGLLSVFIVIKVIKKVL